MTVLGIKRRLALWLVNRVFSGTRFFEAKRQLLNFAGFSIGPGSRVVGPVFCTARLTVGADCWIGRDVKIYGNGQVLLGDRCDLGPEVAFLTGTHAIGSPSRRAGAGESHAIRVGSGCWLGARSTLVGPVTLGPGSVLAACGCALRDIPPHTLAGGVPARVIRSLHEEA